MNWIIILIIIIIVLLLSWMTHSIIENMNYIIKYYVWWDKDKK